MWGLPHKSLKIEAVGFVGNTPNVEAFFPGNRRADFGKAVRVVVRKDAPQAGIQLSLKAANDHTTSSIMVEPLIYDFNGQRQVWTDKAMKSFCIKLAKTIRRQEVAIPAARIAIPQYQSLLAQLKREYKPNRADAVDLEMKIRNLVDTLADAEADLANWEIELPINKKRLIEFQSLAQLSNQVHQHARLRFRVFYVADGQEVNVLSAQPTGSPGDVTAK